MGEGLVVLISGRGSNLQAILKSPVGAQVISVISDDPNASGLDIAQKAGIDTYVVAAADFSVVAEFEEKLVELLQAIAPKIIALAGFMCILTPTIVQSFAGRIVNIHPSLLPNFPGLRTHERALAAGEKEHGCTVHWVIEEIDAGGIIAQKKVPVRVDDTADTLAARVLAEEHRLYPAVLADLLAT
ncbi:phosphoribosylglycinamide formyltransferase [Candidatus Persebacteraceae bacterium Df01]|jgi:phosphoribosylglycinamide formyltransferase-1|uniref:Phosphoribosylglycinamide formyltransferase n=1 Tax=Candidatus Doriopsillibacter californiensis TaxID=2970740 RepID=A0ABT7QP89_9GAMM|nr:phosphoribosylglycinamide formyltransferase [Candidatus Persebacteraceae bacterium Df01]